MLSHKVLTRSSVGDAAAYFADSADDYYAKDGEATEWQGKGAEALGLAGPVEKQRLKELFAGQIGADEFVVRNSTRDDAKHRIGIDFTFSAPKSVSMQALMGGDPAVVKAHDTAVRRALEAAETRAQARHKINGVSRIENTGNLIVAKFRHETSREKDPQLHTHAVILNLTQRADGQWRALKNDDLIKGTKFLGAVYRSELAKELQAAGYTLRHERDGMFELAHITREQLEGFSRRSAQVEARLEAQGLTRETATAAQKQQATMQTRSRKEPQLDRDAVHRSWMDRSRELGIDYGERGWAGAGAQHQAGQAAPQLVIEPGSESAAQALRYAVNHLTERQSIVEERQLIETALKHASGTANLRDIEQAMAREQEKGTLIRGAPTYRSASGPPNEAGLTRQELVQLAVTQGMHPAQAQRTIDKRIEDGQLALADTRYTTAKALERERGTLGVERAGRGAVTPILSPAAAEERLGKAKLTTGQRDAAVLMLTTKDRVVGVQGSAGTGKSHMLNTAKREIEAQGLEVRALAPYGSQVKALRELGVQSNTVMSFLKSKDQNIGPKTVLVIDEAGVMPTRMMEQVLKLAEDKGARVVLMGDVAQTKAIEAGRPFHQLQTAGMATAKMADIQRQTNPELKKAVERVVEGNAVASLRHIEKVHEISDRLERERAVAQTFVALKPEERDGTLIVSGTNESRRHINEAVREGLDLAGKGIEFDTLSRRDTTKAERQHSRYYNTGDLIQPEKDYPGSGLKRGELYRVLDTGPGNTLTVLGKDGAQQSFSPAKYWHLSVYEPRRAELAPGDVVRITRNDAKTDLANGDRLKVAAVAKDAVILTDGKRKIELPADKPLHIDHAYATTVHSSQGLTSDRVIINADSRSMTTDRSIYYVGISRGRQEAIIFTDDKHRLPVAIQRETEKLAALDLKRTREYGHEVPRVHGAFTHDRNNVAPQPWTAQRQNQRQAQANAATAQAQGLDKQASPAMKKARGIRGPEMGG